MYLESIHASKVEETKTEPFVIVKLALHIVRESHLIIAHYGCFPECAHDEYFMRVFLSQRWAFLPEEKWTSKGRGCALAESMAQNQSASIIINQHQSASISIT